MVSSNLNTKKGDALLHHPYKADGVIA